MSTLKLTKSSGVITAAAIDSTALDGFVSVSQSLARGSLTATLTIDFDSIEVEEPAPALVAAFSAGAATGNTKATITGSLASGNHYAYKVNTSSVAVPEIGTDASDTTDYISGADITGVDATTNKFVALYELTASDKVVKFLEHTVIATEIAE